ncbi:MAG TPA: biopolymer transporter ExbD [Opitutaceae bacterium]|jgi:biopolymer transport protein ExbD|nr:biopolymer transporter ExbD [Opitutaceae bacterium]
MAGGSSRPVDGKKKARIEIIPLIDVIFFLLATFVLFTLSLSRIQSVPVQLPVAQPSSAPPDPDLVTLQVSDAGTYFWNREPITANEVAPRLHSYKSQVSTPRVLVSGDSRAKFGPTVFVLDEIRKAGIEQVSIETRVSDTGK